MQEQPAPAEATATATYESLVKLHLDGIYRYARYMTGDSDEAEDIVQKTFIKLFQQLPRLSEPLSVKRWLFKVARNEALDFLKKKKHLQFSEVETAVAEIPESDPGLESFMDSELFEQRFRRLVESLPLPAREIVLLKYFEDMTFQQIAESLGLSENTVKTSFYRAKTNLYLGIKDHI